MDYEDYVQRVEKIILCFKEQLTAYVDELREMRTNVLTREEFRNLMSEHMPTIAEDSGLPEWSQGELDRAYDFLTGNKRWIFHLPAQNEDKKEFTEKEIIDFARNMVIKAGHDPNDVHWCHAEANGPLWQHLATMIWMKMTGKIGKGYFKEDVDDLEIDKNCPKCNTVLQVAPGIGPYCPNNECGVLDDINNTVVDD